jgi:hypothetical protein
MFAMQQFALVVCGFSTGVCFFDIATVPIVVASSRIGAATAMNNEKNHVAFCFGSVQRPPCGLPASCTHHAHRRRLKFPLDYVPRKTTSDVLVGKPILNFAPPVIRFTL